MTRNPRYTGPTYYGHPYLDGRGVFLDGHPLDVSRSPKTHHAHPCPETYSKPNTCKKQSK